MEQTEPVDTDQYGYPLYAINPSVLLLDETADNEPCIHLYSEGMQIMSELSKAAFGVFRLLCDQLFAQPDLDRAELTYNWAQRNGYDTIYRMHNRGIKELLKKEVIYKSTVSGLYYYNVRLLTSQNA